MRLSASDVFARVQAVRRVEAATFEELSARQWARRAVNATGVFPVVEPTLLDGVLGDVRTDETGLRWVCIRIPRGAGKSVLMDTPFGRFAVLVPAGLPQALRCSCLCPRPLMTMRWAGSCVYPQRWMLRSKRARRNSSSSWGEV